jgi:methionyl-tRNA formyltransferase
METYFPDDIYKLVFLDDFPLNFNEYKYIIPWNYKKVIKDVEGKGNVIVVHSSRLPHGRGWAPIYYSFAEQQFTYDISVIAASNLVDAGDVIARASFPMRPNYTAPFIRKVDEEVALILISKIINKWPDGNFIAIKQEGMPTYRKRRSPVDNEISVEMPITQLMPHLRAVEKSSPAFFYHEGVKFIIEIKPEAPALFPKEIKIEYPGINESEFYRSSGRH